MKTLWDIQPTALEYAKATDALTRKVLGYDSGFHAAFMSFDENGDGIIDDGETGRDGMTVTFMGCGLTKTFHKPAYAKITYEDGAGFPSAGCQPVDQVTQKALGGREKDYFPRAHGSGAVAQTADGGFILTATVMSNDGDVSGNHGMSDI